MKTRWKMRANRCGFFLYYDGVLVAQSHNPFYLFRYSLIISRVKGGTLT